ncbi:DUF1801 domain-containing protein [Aquimarina sp. ERC-38]|uniref:DUF1801 domain-containing protein n=1 Tax=Aquimarina sp. ERC-38 TaxID=2949996 RepID=UPI0022483984|nr:DUF1801 domain-containing protein [Aquimarina sp. ERC-38]UZO82194.1 DUF1801 domain-containing protein [Aquimarina sp. ERC-38]
MKEEPLPSIESYINNLPEERITPIRKLRKVIKDNLPKGFSEEINNRTIGFVVPLNLYPKGYHCQPNQPLPFINLASQKNYIALHHMGIYADPNLLTWFKEEYTKHVKTKLDMGKSCIRFKKVNNIPYTLIAELAAKWTPQQWIETYERVIYKKS